MEFLETRFSFENWFLLNSFIDPILYWESHNYRNAILLKWKIFSCAWRPTFFFLFFVCNHKRHSIQNLFQKLNIFKTERSSSEIWDCQLMKLAVEHQVLSPWSCCFFFKLSKNANVLVLLLLIFSFFLQSPMPLIWFSHRSLMEVNSTHVYFRSRMILCFNDEQQKHKTYSKTRASQNIF